LLRQGLMQKPLMQKPLKRKRGRMKQRLLQLQHKLAKNKPLGLILRSFWIAVDQPDDIALEEYLPIRSGRSIMPKLIRLCHWHKPPFLAPFLASGHFGVFLTKVCLVPHLTSSYTMQRTAGVQKRCDF